MQEVEKTLLAEFCKPRSDTRSRKATRNNTTKTVTHPEETQKQASKFRRTLTVSFSPPTRKTPRRKNACSLKKCETATTTTIRLRLQLRFPAKPLAKYPPALSNAHDNFPRKQETKPENHHRLTTHPQILRKQNHKQQQLLLLLQRDKKNSTKLCNNKSLHIGKAEKTPRPRPQVHHLAAIGAGSKQEKRKRKKTSGKREEDARTGIKKVGSSSEWGCLIRV